jgi:hypothetical protein
MIRYLFLLSSGKVHAANEMESFVLKMDSMQLIFQDSDVMKSVKLRKRPHFG